MLIERNLHISISEVAKEVERKLKERVPKDTGALSNSIKAQINTDGFEIQALEYFSYINEGVDGTERKYGSRYSFRDKMPPAKSFKAPTLSAKFAIAKSIFKKGIRPHRITQNLNIDLDKIVEGYSEDITESIKNTLDTK